MAQNKKINILFIVTGLRTGGAEKMLINLIKRMSTERYSISVVSLSDASHYEKEFREQNIELHVLGIRNVYEIHKLFKMHGILRKTRFDIIHSVMFHANIIGRFLKLIYRVKVHISGERNTGNRSSKIHVLLNKFTCPLSNYILCVSDSAMNYLHDQENIRKVPMEVIRNGVEFPEFKSGEKKLKRVELKIADDKVLISTVCRIAPQKDLETLITAFKQVHVQFPNTRLMIVGGTESPEHQMQNDYYRHLVHLTHELSLDEVILFLGDRKDVYELLNASDVFVLSSLWEGIPNALLEAMTVGLPSVSTRVGGVPEIVKDGHSGVLVDPQDPESLAISMMDLIRNPRISTVIARNAQADVRENMNWDVMASRTISVYENLLQVYN